MIEARSSIGEIVQQHALRPCSYYSHTQYCFLQRQRHALALQKRRRRKKKSDIYSRWRIKTPTFNISNIVNFWSYKKILQIRGFQRRFMSEIFLFLKFWFLFEKFWSNFSLPRLEYENPGVEYENPGKWLGSGFRGYFSARLLSKWSNFITCGSTARVGINHSRYSSYHDVSVADRQLSIRSRAQRGGGSYPAGSMISCKRGYVCRSSTWTAAHSTNSKDCNFINFGN